MLRPPRRPMRRYGYAIAQLPNNQLHGEKNTADDETNCFW